MLKIKQTFKYYYFLLNNNNTIITKIKLHKQILNI